MANFALTPSFTDGVLKTNASELADLVRAELKKYSYIVTDETYKTAKDDRAKLNNIASQLADSRKHLESEVFASWKEDKAQIMAIERDLKDASSALGEGIKAIDDEAKKAKAQALEGRWNELGGASFPFKNILADHKAWMNKTAKKSDIEAEMDVELEVLKAQEETLMTQLQTLPEEHGNLIMESFYKSMNLSAALQEVERVRQALARVQQKKQTEAVQAHPVQKPAPEFAKETQEAQKADPVPETQSAQIYRRAFIVDGTREQILALSEAMKNIGIQILDIRGKGEQLPEKLNF